MLFLFGLAAVSLAGPASCQTTGKNPSHADILRGFDAAVFWASREDVDYGGTYYPVGLVIRWQNEIVYRVEGLQFKPDMIALSKTTVQHQAGIAGVQAREAKPDETANFTILLRDADHFLMANNRKASCFMNLDYDRFTGRINKAILTVNLSASDVERCIRHETLHGFGLLNHPHRLHSLLSYYVRNIVSDLTEADIVMLQTLYDPRLKSGMSRLPGLIAADPILEEKRRALNPAAPPKTDSTAIFQAAFADLEKAMANGNARAALYVAEAHRFGIVTPQNPEKMAAIMDQVAQNPDPARRFDIAYALSNGFYVPKDERRAAAIYRRNAEMGHLTSQNNLAVALRDGKGVVQDKLEALMWFTIAAGKNYELAERNRKGLLPQLAPEDQTQASQRAAAWKPVAETAK